MAKESKSSLVWAVKDGYDKRQFTEQQLRSMGTDPGGETFDGWKIVPAAKTPDEVKKKTTTKTDTKHGSKGQSLAEAEATGDASSENTDIIGEDSASGSAGDREASGSH